jgi:hypothetical protein
VSPLHACLVMRFREPTLSTRFLRWLRRTNIGGAVEYLAQLMGALLHPELLRSGASADEKRRPLPGDRLVPFPMWQATRAVTIHAPAESIWPWLAQMGYGRGGWYGWNPLEREDTGVSRLLDDASPPRIGDVWLDGPGCDATRGAFTVVDVETPRTIVLRSVRDPVSGRELDPSRRGRVYIDTAWAFHLEPFPPDATRLLARTRIRTHPRWAIWPLRWLGGGDAVMQRRLLDGIKDRVEQRSPRHVVSPDSSLRAAATTRRSRIDERPRPT